MKKRIMPVASSKVLNSAGALDKPWHAYLEGLPDKARLVDDLGATPTVGQISTAFNDLLAKLKAAGLMED